jgi:1,4-dihydroxy-2-naphthoyl-CoA hydrolase
LISNANKSMTNEQLLEKIANSELLGFLGVEIVSAAPEKVILTMPVTAKVHQYVGIMNGGVSLFLAETAVSIGAVVSVDLTKRTPVGIEINANHLRSVNKGIVTVTATPVYQGRTIAVWQAEITNERGKLICLSRCTLALKAGAAFPPK